jgi:hypothetical protein
VRCHKPAATNKKRPHCSKSASRRFIESSPRKVNLPPTGVSCGELEVPAVPIILFPFSQTAF